MPSPAYYSHHDHGSNYGPVVGALFFIALVIVGSLALARYCVGAQAFYRTGYNLDAYVQHKFAVCLGTGHRKPPAVSHPMKKKASCDLQPEAAAEEVDVSEPLSEEEEESSSSAGASAADP